MSNEKRLFELIGEIKGLDEDAMKAAKERQDYLAKPPGSLGRLEDIAVKIAGITGKPVGNDVTRQCVAIMCADNGVVEEGVASAPQSVTLSQTINFTRRYNGEIFWHRSFGYRRGRGHGDTGGALHRFHGYGGAEDSCQNSKQKNF